MCWILQIKGPKQKTIVNLQQNTKSNIGKMGEESIM